MTSKQRVSATLDHRQPDRVPVDFGSTFVSGVHVSCVAALRDYFGLEKKPVKAIDPGQMLGEIEEDLKAALGIDTQGIFRRNNRFGFPNEGWKPWRMYDGLEILVPGGFNITIDHNGDTLMHPLGDTSLPPSSRMPNGGYFFDPIMRQGPIDDDHLNPADNLEEYVLISDDELAYLERAARRAAGAGRAVVASFGGTSFGDIAHVPGVGLRNPKGIRDITEWYISTRARRDYVNAVFAGQTEIALANLARIAPRLAEMVDMVNICGTDFGTQKSSFCSVATFRELWMPYYRRVNDWIHKNTRWRTFKHSCGAVEKFIPSFIESGFDVLNPVQCSAAGMAPEVLKQKYGPDLVFWGGGVDTQQVLPFGTPQQVREQVLSRCQVFSQNGGYVFNTVHNIQAQTPVENIVAMVEAVREFNGK
ncbi:MAG: methyltransferase [Acidobacteriia bacterium]|nr:methyltransferase [Terriglobia bacterium]